MKNSSVGSNGSNGLKTGAPISQLVTGRAERFLPALDATGSSCSIEAQEFQLFRALIHQHTGIWLRDGKQTMLASRLSRRLRHHGLSSYSDYYELVKDDGARGEEIGQLINCVTTNKTSFFREKHHFEFLTETVLPEIANRARVLDHAGTRTAEKHISLWSAACSTGEEPYSLAMSLLDAKRTVLRGEWISRVVASDIDTQVLEKAAHGTYSEADLGDIDPLRQKRYLLRGKGSMSGQIKVKQEVASLVEFKRINLMDSSWPLETTFDAIFFRNALIYFQQETQDRVLRRMVRYLKPGGYLFLGHSESIPWLHGILEPLQNTVYRLRAQKA